MQVLPFKFSAHLHQAFSWRLFVSGLIFLGACAAGLSHGHGAYHDVVTEINRELLIRPGDAALHFKLARAHQEHGEWTLTLAEVERVDRLEPGRYETGLLRARALATGGHWPAACGVLDRFLIAHPGHPGALAERARLLLKLDRREEALADFRAALAGAGEVSAEWFVEAANAFLEARQKDDAVLILRRGLTKLGDDPELLQRSLEVELIAAHFDEALARVAAMEKAAPRREPWMARRARILAQAGRSAEAKAAWQTLRDHLLSLPSLERGTPLLTPLLAEARRALGEAAPVPVVAPPAP